MCLEAAGGHILLRRLKGILQSFPTSAVGGRFPDVLKKTDMTAKCCEMAGQLLKEGWRGDSKSHLPFYWWTVNGDCRLAHRTGVMLAVR